jgi:hypothetical protein
MAWEHIKKIIEHGPEEAEASEHHVGAGAPRESAREELKTIAAEMARVEDALQETRRNAHADDAIRRIRDLEAEHKSLVAHRNEILRRAAGDRRSALADEG